MPIHDDDRRALAARLAANSPAAADAVAAAVEDGEELREVLVDVDGEVVALTDRRALLVAVGSGEARAFAYDRVAVRRRDEGLGVDAIVEGDTLVLEVARSTFVRLGVVGQGNPPGRATWLPVRTPTPPAAAPATPEPVGRTEPPASALPPPGWHPDPSGRHWWRWWDGRGWTEHVADGGAPYVDPLPPR